MFSLHVHMVINEWHYVSDGEYAVPDLTIFKSWPIQLMNMEVTRSCAGSTSRST